MKNFRIIICIICILAPYPATASEKHNTESGTSDRKISISATSMKADYAGRKVRFEGSVEVTGRDLRLKCRTVQADYGEDGEVKTLSASGNVRFEYQELKATAGTAELDMKQHKIVLTENPVVTRKGIRIQGEVIILDLKDGELEVRRAKGVFHTSGP